MEDIYLIILDTLRLDYSKEFEYLAKTHGFVKLDRAIAPAPWTVPSHASIFTGLYPSYHRAHETKKIKIPEVRLKYTPLLTHKLREVGFDTYLLSANVFITPVFGFTGFSNVYFYTPYSPVSLTKRYTLVPNILKKSLQKSLNFLKLVHARFHDNWPRDKGISGLYGYLRDMSSKPSPKRRFVVLNLMEVHEPYSLLDDLSVLERTVLGDPVDNKVYSKWKRGYKRESNYLSKRLGDILELIPEDALVIITSDHGQLLGENGLLGHGNFLHDELIRVPLYVRNGTIGDFDGSIKENNWISLISLYNLILSYAKTDTLDLSMLYSKFAISETYGIAGKVNPQTDAHRQRVEALEQHRIAFFYKSYKVIFNVTSGRIEAVYDIARNRKIDIDSFDELSRVKEYIRSFLSLSPSLKIKTKIRLSRNK